MMDVGGSMDPHAHLVSRLFSAAKRASNIRELKTYYFHNCIYGRLYTTETFQEPRTLREVFDGTTPEWKLVIVGDAAMHPAELLGAGDWEYYASRGDADGAKPGVQWMMQIADTYRRGVWLNPDPPTYWQSGTAEVIARFFPMYALTLDGLGEAIGHLSKGQARRA